MIGRRAHTAGSGRRFALCLLAAAWIFGPVPGRTQGVATGIQEYFVLGFEQHVWDMMDKVQNGEGGAQFADGMSSVVTAAASADNQVIYYDFWEDGLEADIFNPVQATTLVVGDGDPSNGDACDFNSDPCGVDQLLTGSFVNFASNQGLGGGCAVPSADPTLTSLCESVPVNPRCAAAGACTAAETRFDGGDRLVTSGGPLAIVHSQDPLTQFIGGATEMLPRQAVVAARSYSVPVGEDLYVADSPTEPFHYVDLNLVAFDDNTQILVNSPGAGSVSLTLDRGEHWSSLGFVDDGPATPALALTINAGTKISTTKPVAGLIFTGGDGTWATRHYALLPDILHATDYVVTAPGDDPAAGPSAPTDRPLDLYILNPNPLSSIVVNTTDSLGSASVTVPPNSVVDYSTAAGRFVPSGSTVRLTSNQNFWGISGYDFDTNISDWGHSWLASRFLTRSYTVSFAPGNLDPAANMVNLNGVFVAATQDNTEVRVDLDGDGDFDGVDTDGDGTVDAGLADPACDPATPNCVYVVDSLAALRIFDPNDFDNTGTRIEANKPVAVAWGQDTDLTGFGDVALDTGFTVYPTDQLFLAPVLTIDKEVLSPVVPTAGGVATYSLTLRTYEFGPMTDLEIYDLLPVGVAGADYVPGSTLVTYPDLTQDTSDPAISIDPGTGRARLDWALSPDTMGMNQSLTVRYSVDIPPAPGGLPRRLTNEAHAQGELGGSIFSPFDTGVLTQSDIFLSKSVDDPSPQAGDVLTYTLSLTNNGFAETGVVITDPIPPGSTFCDAATPPAGTCSDPSGPVPPLDAPGGFFDPGQNAVVWTAANLPGGGPHTLTFQVRVDPGAPAGIEITNRASYESNETPFFPSNPAVSVVVGPNLVTTKSGPALLHPNEVAIFEIVVENTGSAAATNVRITDPLPLTNAAYVPESMQWRLNVEPFVDLTDAADGDEGTLLPGRLELLVASLGPGEDLTFRFEARVAPGTAGGVVNNQATVSSDRTAPRDTNLVQIPIVGDADITGHVFLDLDGDGVQDPGEPDLPNVDVVVVDAAGNVQRVTTDASGDYLATVEPGPATTDVDESDPDFPVGATLTTANDPQGVGAVSGASTPTTPVGYRPAPLDFTKSSGAGGQVVPGETISYTITAENLTGTVQTGLTITDPLPAGTLAVPGSTTVTVVSPVFRVREYFVAPGAFGGTVFDLTLAQPLAPEYFAMVQGSAGGGGSGGDRDPEADYARLTQDPFGTGDLAASAGPSVLRIERRDGADDWVGVVTVVECLAACASAGFELLTVEEVMHAGASESGSDTAAVAWTDIGQVMLMGGFQGAGCFSDETTDRDHPVCHARLFPSGSDQIEWTRDGSNGSVALSAATSTVMVLEWGSEWNVERVRVTGTNGGGGLNAAGEYNTAPIAPVDRAETWVWGTGHADGQGIGDQAEGVAITLGDGVAQNAVESQVAVGTEISGTGVDFEVWVLSHPGLAVDYRFKADGDSGNLIVDQAVDLAGSERMALVTNGQAGTSDNYPRPIFSARYLGDTTVRLERRRTGSAFPAWVTGVDFTGVQGVNVFAGGDPAALVTAADSVSLAPGGRVTVSFQLRVDPDLGPGISQITNTATLDTDQEPPQNASATDEVVRPAVTVEPNNGNFVVFDALQAQTRTYSHVVTNTGDVTDSYDITALSELGAANPGAGWTVELIDPDTGTVLATDTDFGDSTWNGGVVINTGSLAPGAEIFYDLRVTVPAGMAVGTEETTTLTAISDLAASVSAFATDETTVVGAAGPVVLVADQSGIVTAGGSIAYSHRIFNNTGATDTFDLTAFPTEPGWSATIYNDSNGDGVFTPGTDVAIMNTLQLPDGGSQLFFVVVDAAAGAQPGDTDITHITAISRADSALFDAVSDTTTVTPASTHDLSGGDTLVVSPGEDCTAGNGCPIFPGTLKSLSATADRFDFTITASPFFGLDGLPHPTRLLIDSDSDGVPDLQIAEDADGDGTWDTIAAGFDTDMDGEPDVGLAGGGELAYELRRPVDPNQGSYRDPVTLTAISQATGERDSVTAVNLLATFTHALLAEVRAFAVGGRVFLEWSTALEVGTAGFEVFRVDAAGRPRRVGPTVPALPGSRQGGATYRLLDPEARPGERHLYWIVELDRRGGGRIFGPFDLEAILAPGAAPPPAGESYDAEARRSVYRPRVEEPASLHGAAPVERVEVGVEEDGLVQLTAEGLAAAFFVPTAEVRAWIAAGELRLTVGARPDGAGCAAAAPGPGGIFADGFESGDFCAWSSAAGAVAAGEVAWLPLTGGEGLVFWGEAVRGSIYTDRRVYSLEHGPGLQMAALAAGAPAAVPGEYFTERLHFEEEQYPVTSVATDPEGDFWLWEFFQGGHPTQGTKSFAFEAPDPDPASSASLTIELLGETDAPDVAPDHRVEARLGGASAAVAWDGGVPAGLTLELAPGQLQAGSNSLVLEAELLPGVAVDLTYLESFDLVYRRAYRAVGDRLLAPAEGRAVLTVEGLTRPDVEVFDLSSPRRPRRLVGLAVEPAGAGFRVSFRTAGEGPYLVQPLATAATLVPVPDAPSDLLSAENRGEYLVIAAAGLEAAAEELAAHRAGRGLESMVVRVDDVYDELAGGVVSPWAIKDFLAWAWQNWELPPRWVVLAGDSSFDYKDRLGLGENMLPSPLVATPEGLFSAENRLADLEGGDGVPELALGRIPAHTNAELSAYVAKLAAWEAAGFRDWKTRSAWIADDTDEGGDFTADSEALLALAPASLSRERIYVDTLGHLAARQRTLERFTAGAQLVSYLGHGGLDRLADAGLLTTADVAGLGGGRPPILAALTCAVGRFDLPGFDTLSETLVSAPDGGALVVLSPSGLSLNAEARILGERLLARGFERQGVRVGDAARRALADYSARAEADPLLPFLMTLLGDPAIVLEH